MRRLAASVAAVGLGLGSSCALAYDSPLLVENVQFHWATDGLARGWTSSAANSLSAISNATYFSDLGGNNSTTYYNPDFAKEGDATGWCPAGAEAFQSPYGCQVGTMSPINDVGPGAKATGTLTVTGTTLTGTLTVINTNDEGAPPGTGLTEASGYNVRSADGSPFGNVWYGVSNQMTLAVNLTGTFNPTNWEINGGTVGFADPAFQCKQGGFGMTLCNPSGIAGGFQANGSMLGWGIDQATGTGTGVGEIPVYNADGSQQIATLSGVLMSITVDASGNLTTIKGEIRMAAGSAGGGCPTSIRWNGSSISCGTLQVMKLDLTPAWIDPPDDDPDPFSFTPATGVPLGAVVTSDPITITGIDTAVPVSITGGEYSVNSGVFTSAPGTVVDGDTISVRQVSASTLATTTTAVLTVGVRSAGFAVTTIPSAPFVISDDSAVAQVGTPLDIDVLANDELADAATAIIEILTAPLNGTASIVGTGAGRVARYVPAPGFQGQDSFQYAVQDGDRIGLATVTVVVLDDVDGDGIAAALDNCTTVANPDQRDTDGDGYGNVCDADLNNDGIVNFADLSIFRTRFLTNDPDADFNGDGIVNFADLARFRQLFGVPPGPSGLRP